MADGITVELAIEDRLLADRVEAMLRELEIDLAEPGSDAVSIVISDGLPDPATPRTVIVIADDVDALAALRGGVSGVLPASAEIADLRIALDAAMRGLAVAPLREFERDGADFGEAFEDTETADPVHLTAREREVLSLMAEGASNKEIARKLAISVHTAKFHVASILEKLDATGRTDAVAHAIRLGLLML